MIEKLYAALPYFLPPVLGAVIGYVTNAIAIRMLFRPLTEKYIFKIKIPFTPGIIPKQRGNLAENIARMVSDELLTEDAMRKQIQSENFQAGIYKGVSSFTEKILKAEIGKKTTGNLEMPVPIEKARGIITTLLKDFFSSGTFSDILHNVIYKVFHFLFSIDVKDLLRRVDRKHIEKLLETLTSEKAEEAVQRMVKNGLAGKLDTGTKINAFLSEDVIHAVSAVFESLYPDIFSALMEWLKKQSTRDQMEYRGRFLVRDMLDKLTAFQRFFISAAQYDRVIEEKMPEIVWDVIRMVEQAGNDRKNQNELFGAAEKALTEFGKKELSELSFLADKSGQGQIERIIHQLFVLLEKPGSKSRIADIILKRIQDMKPVSISEIMNKAVGYTEEEAASFIAEKTVLWFDEKGDEISGVLYDFIADMFQNMEAKPLGELISIHREGKEKIDHFFAERLVSIIDEKTPQILKSVDFGKIVIDKINGLDMENVEKLLLMVIEKHLRWINILGGVLGAFIGTLQIVINQLL